MSLAIKHGVIRNVEPVAFGTGAEFANLTGCQVELPKTVVDRVANAKPLTGRAKRNSKNEAARVCHL
jgi:hypothetical protein